MRKSAKRLRTWRLLIEPLESRQLLAGINVSVYVDVNGSRGFEASGDTPAANRLVYVDLDGNGVHSLGDPVAVTDGQGVARFSNLPAGEYDIGLLANSQTQNVVDPARVAPVGERLASVASQSLLHNADLSLVWGVSSSGRLTPLSSEPQNALQATELGGYLLAWVAIDADRVGVLFDTESGRQFAEFNLRSGDLVMPQLSGLATGEHLAGLTTGSQQLFALINGPQGNAIARLVRSTTGSFSVADRVSTQATTIVASLGSERLLALTPIGNQTRIDLLDSDSAFETQAVLTVPERVTEAVWSATGDVVAVATPSGVRTYRPGVNALTLVAELGEATGPLSAASWDGRLLTGNAANPQEIIVWDPQSWQPVGRSRSAGGNVRYVTSDRRGDVALLSGTAGVDAISLAVAGTQRVQLPNAQATASVRLGVQTTAENRLPDIQAFEHLRTTAEDTPDAFDWLDSGLVDPDGDALWFTLSTPAQHGVVSFDQHGGWSYRPDPNFSGRDSAVLRLHDGQSTTLLRIEWDVTPVNDPPVSISVHTAPLSEDSPLGTELGFVAIVDPDRDAAYRITTNDPRFTVDQGRIYFSSGTLDFETEPTIVLQFQAVDVSEPSISISAVASVGVADANDPPTGLRLIGSSVAENQPGGDIGRVEVIDPDASDEYDFFVSDPRFIVVGDRLRLADGETLNFEESAEWTIAVTARDRQRPAYQQAAEFRISVTDRDDPPQGLTLSRFEVSERTDGAVVGEVRVVDEDGDPYQFTVSDSRFEVVDGVLKLRDGVQLDGAAASQLTITVVATGHGGASVTNAFPLQVVPPRSPWQNPSNPNDVNGDGLVTPLDVLLTINQLNRGGAQPLPATGNDGGTGEPPPVRPDVNGDGLLTPLDALLIINELNRSRGGEGEGLVSDGGLASQPTPAMMPDGDRERQKKENSEIDAELELLLDQLTGNSSRD